jgi:hypothetical protein
MSKRIRDKSQAAYRRANQQRLSPSNCIINNSNTQNKRNFKDVSSNSTCLLNSVSLILIVRLQIVFNKKNCIGLDKIRKSRHIEKQKHHCHIILCNTDVPCLKTALSLRLRSFKDQLLIVDCSLIKLFKITNID